MPAFKYIFDRFVVTEIDIIAFLQYYAISNAITRIYMTNQRLIDLNEAGNINPYISKCYTEKNSDPVRHAIKCRWAMLYVLIVICLVLGAANFFAWKHLFWWALFVSLPFIVLSEVPINSKFGGLIEKLAKYLNVRLEQLARMSPDELNSRIAARYAELYDQDEFSSDSYEVLEQIVTDLGLEVELRRPA